MSFDVFLNVFKDGEPFGIDRDLVRREFGDAIVEEDPEYSRWRLQYGDNPINSCDVYVSGPNVDPAAISSLLVNRPVAEERLWDSLYRIMRLGHFVLYFPGGRSPLFADEHAIRHCPAGLVEALGPPRVVRAGREIREAIECA